MDYLIVTEGLNMIPHQVSNVFKQYGALALCTSVLGYEMQLNFPVAQIKRDGGLLNSHDCLYIAKETQNSSVQTFQNKTKQQLYVHKREREFGPYVWGWYFSIDFCRNGNYE